MIEAIIFDKDGTLIDFDSFWVPVSVNAINHLLREVKGTDIPMAEFLTAIGVENGVSDIDGLLCKGTYEQIAIAINKVLEKHGCNISNEDIVQMVVEAYNLNTCSGEIRPTCKNIKDVLYALKERGIKLAVVTTDNFEITHKCLEALEIESLFDKIYTDDGATPVKPDPHCVFDFCQLTGINKDNVVMVGDTMTDVYFAMNAGISIIGVGAATEKRERLVNYVDAVVSDISQVFEYIKG